MKDRKQIVADAKVALELSDGECDLIMKLP